MFILDMAVQADKKIESFAVDSTEEVLYYGTISGQIVTLDLDDFTRIGEIQAHAGTIIAMVVPPNLPYLACLSMDRTVSVWCISEKCRRPMGAASIRNVVAPNDTVTYLDVSSNAQAIAFHPEERRIATRTANGAIAEITFDSDGQFTLLRCTRFHELYDVVTVRYTAEPPYHLLTGSGNGEAVQSDEGTVLRRWQIEHESIHWFEYLHRTQYLVASDSRLLARIDLTEDRITRLGPKFAADDFEHVVVNRHSGRVFASSFDRNIYELDPQLCVPISVAFRAPFKCRWLHSLSKAPERLIVQVRDGSLLEVNVDTGRDAERRADYPDCAVDGYLYRPEDTNFLR